MAGLTSAGLPQPKPRYVQDSIFRGKVSNKLSDYKDRDEMRREQKHLKAFLAGKVYYTHGTDLEGKPKKFIVGGRAFQIQPNWMQLAKQKA